MTEDTGHSNRDAASAERPTERPKLKRKEYEKKLRERRPNSALCRTGSSELANASSLCSRVAMPRARAAPLGR